MDTSMLFTRRCLLHVTMLLLLLMLLLMLLLLMLVVVLLLGRRHGRIVPTRLILAGVAYYFVAAGRRAKAVLGH